MTIDTTCEQLESVLMDLTKVVASIDDDHLDDPTPCAEFDVRQLRHHVLGWLSVFAAAYAHPEGRGAEGIEDYTVSDDPAGEAARIASTLVAAVRAGAAERELWLGPSAMPGELALGMILWEYQVHGWDLARATGQTWSPPEAGLRESLEFAPMMLTDDYQGPGKPFGPQVEVPSDASALDLLLGVSGRDPRWEAARRQ